MSLKKISKTSVEIKDIPTFSVQECYGNTWTFSMTGDEVIIGRDSDSDIVVDRGEASRKHAKVFRDGDKFWLEDLNSVNGTFLNSDPVSTRQEIKHMDIIQIGSCMLVFNDPNNLGTIDDTQTRRFSKELSFEFIKDVIKKLEQNIGKVFKGKPEIIRNILICLFADGHLLIEDVPGVGKSLLAQVLAKSIQANYKRIQFTPDMLPSDITGMNIYNEQTRGFEFMPGPIFGNVILADEINRTPPRTQSSLLECMSESVVTIDGHPHVLPKPFFVMATQNPDDYHGTYPLPEPQLDRFMMRISIGYPDEKAEKDILTTQAVTLPLNQISYVIKAMDVVRCNALVRSVTVSDAVKEYIVAIADATRRHPALTSGCSPRASLALMRISQSLAAYRGRDYVIPKDVRAMVKLVLAHRINLKLRHQGEWNSVDNVIDSIIESIPMKNEDKGLCQ
ncbi:MAG: AAA family ATPase [Victivallaceae bacterium]|nr:AAA family ATPase [Victivallaceae bacterium]